MNLLTSCVPTTLSIPWTTNLSGFHTIVRISFHESVIFTLPTRYSTVSTHNITIVRYFQHCTFIYKRYLFSITKFLGNFINNCKLNNYKREIHLTEL